MALCDHHQAPDPLNRRPSPPGVFYLPQALKGQEQPLTAALKTVLAEAPPIQARTRGSGTTSAAMTNCKQVGWWSDARGCPYQVGRPDTCEPWPPIPGEFHEIVGRVMAGTPWPTFEPDACLINYYRPGAKMGLHQDRDAKDFTQPIVTVCLGDDADFMVGGFARADKVTAFVVSSSDVVVMGGANRMRFHGIRKIYPGTSPLPDIAGRYSLTFRKAF